MQEVGPVHRHMRRLLRGVLAGLEYESVLDVGCGAGHNLPLLRAGGDERRLAGVDVSAAALERARAKAPDAEFVQLDIQTERLDGRWDLVFSSLVLEHLPNDVDALRNMRAMTGKHLLVTTIAGDFERYRAWDEQMGHVRNYALGELEEKAERTGFTVQQVIYWGFPFYAPIARRLQNRMRAEAAYGLSTRVLARAMFLLYYLNSRRKGDLLVLLGAV
jgi:trans-aconitate methyltransferase